MDAEFCTLASLAVNWFLQYRIADRRRTRFTATTDNVWDAHDRVQGIKSIINKVEYEYDAGAPVDVVIERAEDDGISEEKAEHEIEKLKDKVKMYDLQADHLQTS